MYLDDKNVGRAIVRHLDDRSRLVTDGAQTYKFITDKHESVEPFQVRMDSRDVHNATPLKASSVSSSAVCRRVPAHGQGSILTATWPSSIPHEHPRETRDRRWPSAPALRSKASRASGSCIKQLIKGKRLSISEQLVFDWMKKPQINICAHCKSSDSKERRREHRR